MESLYLLIPLSLVIVAIAVWIFIRASETGQFDDLEGPGHSILMDDDRPRPPPARVATTSRADGQVS